MVAIDEISGVYDHTDECTAQVEMERNPRLPLHADLREFALSLLRKNVPLSLLRSECSAWAQARWSGLPGDNFSRYCLTTHDISSLYRSISHERGIPQRTAAEDNLDKWFLGTNKQMRIEKTTQMCIKSPNQVARSYPLGEGTHFSDSHLCYWRGRSRTK
jgi:hypothetical protein